MFTSFYFKLPRLVSDLPGNSPRAFCCCSARCWVFDSSCALINIHHIRNRWIWRISDQWTKPNKKEVNSQPNLFSSNITWDLFKVQHLNNFSFVIKTNLSKKLKSVQHTNFFVRNYVSLISSLHLGIHRSKGHTLVDSKKNNKKENSLLLRK